MHEAVRAARQVRESPGGRSTGPFALLLALVLSAGCSVPAPQWYSDQQVRKADREGYAVVDEFAPRIVDQFDDGEAIPREDYVLYPEVLPEETDQDAGLQEVDLELQQPPVQALLVDLESALAHAVEGNRGFQSARESLFLDGLSYHLTRFAYTPQLNAGLSYDWAKSQVSRSSAHSAGANLGVSQILPTGGSIGIGGGFNAVDFGGGADDAFYSSSVSASIRQPLLRGAGYDIAWENLTQGERSMVYAIRDFERRRQDLSIQISETFFALVGQKRQLQNLDDDLELAEKDVRKAEALKSVGRGTESGISLAKRRLNDARNSVIETRTNYQRALDRFKVDLGLAASTVIDIVEQDPPFEAVRLEPESAIEVALHNNLNVMDQRQQLEDAERQFRLAGNDLLPDADLNLGVGLAGGSEDFSRAGPDEWSASAGISLEIPLQRQRQRAAYRQRMISIERSRRGYEEFLDDFRNGVLDDLRGLQQLEEQIGLDEERIEQETRNVRIAEIKLDQGTGDPRDLIEARESEIAARNTLIANQTRHFIGRLRLLQTLGILFIDENGMWR